MLQVTENDSDCQVASAADRSVPLPPPAVPPPLLLRPGEAATAAAAGAAV